MNVEDGSNHDETSLQRHVICLGTMEDTIRRCGAPESVESIMSVTFFETDGNDSLPHRLMGYQ